MAAATGDEDHGLVKAADTRRTAHPSSRRPGRGVPSPLRPGSVVNHDWLDRLHPASPDRDAAIGSLHELLLKGARFEVNRRSAGFPQMRGGDLDDLANQAADEALVAVLGKLESFRGDSRVTTWAYKFALLEAAVKVRRRAWQKREVPLEPESWGVFADRAATPQQDAETSELFGALGQAIEAELSPHQREVLVAVTLNDVPIDVLAERLRTTRGALYKTIHDARRKLRAALSERGLGIEVQGANPPRASTGAMRGGGVRSPRS